MNMQTKRAVAQRHLQVGASIPTNTRRVSFLFLFRILLPASVRPPPTRRAVIAFPEEGVSESGVHLDWHAGLACWSGIPQNDERWDTMTPRPTWTMQLAGSLCFLLLLEESCSLSQIFPRFTSSVQ
jgi:hypothetical protein